LRQHLQTQQSYDNNIIGYADGGPPPNVFWRDWERNYCSFWNSIVQARYNVVVQLTKIISTWFGRARLLLVFVY
jgi:hypothetical protein